MSHPKDPFEETRETPGPSRMPYPKPDVLRPLPPNSAETERGEPFSGDIDAARPEELARTGRPDLNQMQASGNA